MTLQKLRVPCEHGRYEGHGFSVGYRPTMPPAPPGVDSCPGGRSATIEDLAEALRTTGVGMAMDRLVDAINDLEEGIEAGGDIADESEEVYDGARELRGQLDLVSSGVTAEEE